MMGLDTPESCRSWRNILSCKSSRFLFTRLYRDARSIKQKKKSSLQASSVTPSDSCEATICPLFQKNMLLYMELQARCSIHDSLRYESSKHTHSVPVRSTLTLLYIYVCVFWVFLFLILFCQNLVYFSLPYMLHSAPNPFSLILDFWKYTVKILREERWLRGFENRLLMKIFESKRRLMVCTPQQILLRW
jgi:hypothetical protein